MLHLSDKSTVVVIGPPGSGKTYVGELLAEQSGLSLYSTDEFLSNGHVAALYAVMQACGDDGYVIEGMIGYRWLRKRKQLNLPPPDIVIQLEATDSEIQEAYKRKGRHCNLSHINRFCKAHESVLDDYYLIDGDMPKIWIHSKSHHISRMISSAGA
jgi:adenylate kinase family enzyme